MSCVVNRVHRRLLVKTGSVLLSLLCWATLETGLTQSSYRYIRGSEALWFGLPSQFKSPQNSTEQYERHSAPMNWRCWCTKHSEWLFAQKHCELKQQSRSRKADVMCNYWLLHHGKHMWAWSRTLQNPAPALAPTHHIRQQFIKEKATI